MASTAKDWRRPLYVHDDHGEYRIDMRRWSRRDARWARRIASEVLGACGGPCNPFKIVDRFNIRVVEIPGGTLVDAGHGMYSGFDRRIYLNASRPMTEKLFTLSHEIGHYFAHEYGIGDKFRKDGGEWRRLIDDEEGFACCFANTIMRAWMEA